MTTNPRRRTIRHWLALGLLALAAAGWVAGCKQGEGERCQSQDDCTDPLVCNLATLTCGGMSTSGQIDATIADGPPADAAVDAVDAMIDAMIDAP